MENSRLDRAKVAFRFVPPHNRISGRMKIGSRAKKPSKLLSPRGKECSRRRSSGTERSGVPERGETATEVAKFNCGEGEEAVPQKQTHLYRFDK